MKKVLIILVVLTMVATLFVGCNNSKEKLAEEQILRSIWSSEPESFDPHVGTSSDVNELVRHTYDALIRVKDGKVLPSTAESWTVSADGKEYIFKIRKDAKWSDGVAVTAKDYEYGWKRGFSPTFKMSWLYFYTNIEGASAAVRDEKKIDAVGIKAVDDYTLKVTLTRPTEWFLTLLNAPAFSPARKDLIEKYGTDGSWASDPKKAVSNGPFKLAEYKQQAGFTLVRNENYWDVKNIKLTEYEIKIVPDKGTAFTAHKAGESHTLFGVPVDEIPRLMVEDPTLIAYPLNGTTYLFLNLREDVGVDPLKSKLMRDLKFRKALAMAIDREAICAVMAGGEPPALGVIPPAMTDPSGAKYQVKTNLDSGLKTDASLVPQAQKLFEELGYPMGKGLPTFKYAYQSSDTNKKVAEAIQEMWKKNLGFNVELENYEGGVITQRRKAGQFEILRVAWIADYFDPTSNLSILQSKDGNNFAGWKNSAFDAAMDKAAATSGVEHANAIYEANKIAFNDMACIPINHYVKIVMVGEMVKGTVIPLDGAGGALDFSRSYIVEVPKK